MFTYCVNTNGCDMISDIGICSLANSLAQLEVLEIANAAKVISSHLIIIFDVYMTQVSDAGLRLLALKCPNLIRLNFSNCHGMVGAGLGAIADHCHDVTCTLRIKSNLINPYSLFTL